MATQNAGEASTGAEDTGTTGADGSIDNGGEKVDFKALFGETKEKLSKAEQETQRISQEFSNFKAGAEKSMATLEKLKSAFIDKAGDSGELDPHAAEIAELENEIQNWVADAHEADKRGKPITRTAQLGIKQAQDRIAAIKKEAAAEKKIKELEAKLSKLEDPEHNDLQSLYNTTDHLIQNALNSVFGNDPQYDDVKETQFQAIARQVGKEFKSLMEDKENPNDWQRIKRDRNALQKLVQHFVKQNIPPVARKLMDDDILRKTPTTFEDLYGAFKEAKAQWQKNKSPQAKATMDELKGKVWDAYAQRQLKSNRFKTRDLMD